VYQSLRLLQDLQEQRAVGGIAAKARVDSGTGAL